MKLPGRGQDLAALLVFVLLVALPFVAGRFYVQLTTEIMTLAILALGLGLLISMAGLVSLGHAAFSGTAAYLVVILTRQAGGPASIWWLLPAVLAATALLALVIGAMIVRTRGVYTIMATLAFGQMLFYFFHDTPIAGGSDGAFLSSRPSVAIGDLELLDLGNRTTVFYVALGALVLVVLFVRRLIQSPFGLVTAAIRANEPRARALGHAPLRFKLAAFVIAGMLAGLAGVLDVVRSSNVNPEIVGWRASAGALLMVILGGLHSFYGPLIGAAAFVLVEHVLVGWTTHWALPMGVFIIAVVLLLPGGLVSLPERLQWLIRSFRPRR